MKKLIIILIMALSATTFAQTGIGTTTPNASAQLDVSSTTKGFLPPRVALTGSTSASPLAAHVAGMVVFNTATAGDVTPGLYVNNGTIWEKQAGGVTPGTTAGDMQYWNGTAWVVIPATTNEGATLTAVGGVPTWTGGTPPPPSVTNPTTNKIWMDRNLGATQVATSSTDAAAYGDLYQWGRGSDGHQLRTSANTSTLSSADVPEHASFITTSSSPYDWRSPQNSNLWQGVNGVNNPCPSGFRIPTFSELEAERTSWSSNNSAGAFASPLKLPVAGYRVGSNGSLIDVGSFGGYWSSTVDGSYSRFLYFNSSFAFMNSDVRAGGLSVRCLKD